ncbi:pyridoxal phosphate-dependent decarboxylase family protein [Nocardioides sp. Leaf307]|uniref:pyridoxal phosphate-dependent decarboxylase family protein n=1 Tax=Nocardioides sp. Leaf307 TaxID=1736331 RepID=UPI000A95E76D|nr:pyridoxal-dependent decarboxylase [Nocardioides sp. Leaf307]
MPPSPRALAHLFHPDHADAYVASMRLGVDHLADALTRVSGPATGVGPAQAAKPVLDVDLDAPLEDPAAALEEMGRLWLDDTVWFHEPTYAAHLNCPVVIPALLAEVFVSGVNASLDTFDQSVAGTFVERHLVAWTAGRIGWATGPDAGPGAGTVADGIFTSGGSQSNLQALHLARDRALAAGAALADLRVLASVDAHFSVQKSARLLGLPAEAVVAVGVDARRRLDPARLADALDAVAAEGRTAMAVVATAGTTDFGAIDPLAQVADLTERHGCWLHVDAAYGGGLLVSPTQRERLDGIERADSVTVDFHKTWFQPVSSSAVLVRDARTLGHVAWHADYLNPRDPGGAASPNQVDKSLQTTRRFDALKLWLTLRVMGPEVIGEYVDTVTRLALEVGEHLAADRRVELAAVPELSTVVFRYRPPGLGEDSADRLVPLVRSALYERGLGMVAATTLEGRRWLKLTLLNPMATTEDLLGVVDHCVALAEELLGEVAA